MFNDYLLPAGVLFLLAEGIVFFFLQEDVLLSLVVSRLRQSWSLALSIAPKYFQRFARPKIAGSVFGASMALAGIFFTIEQYTMASVCIWISAVTACVLLVQLKGLKRAVRTGRRRFTYKANPWLQVVVCIPVLLLASYVTSKGNQYALSKRLLLHSDWLLPANDPMPDNNCRTKAPSDSLIIMLGSKTSWSRKFPHTVFEVSGVPRFTIDKNEQGAIAITTDVMDRNDDAIVEIDKNHFTVANDAFKVVREDLSTLSVVVKHHKEEVLYVRYVNPRVLKIRGVFNYGNWSMEATENGVHVPGFFNDSGCNGGTTVDYMFGG